MNNKLTWPEAYSKIIEAYFKDEIQPLRPKFCFCGTLCGNTKWHGISVLMEHNDYLGYSAEDFKKMEVALLITLGAKIREGRLLYGSCLRPHDYNYENKLFDAMSAALDVLKEIHRSRGENVDDVPVFTKRPSQTVCSK